MLSHSHAEVAAYRYVVFVDSSRQYIDFTDDVCDLLGYTRQELLRKKIEDVSYDASVHYLFAEFQKTGTQEGDYVLQRKDREPVLMHYRSFIFSDGCNAAVWEPISDWRQPYISALLETDPHKLSTKVQKALEAIARTPHSDGPTQRLINSATMTLNSLNRGTDLKGIAAKD
jgi:PAS domain-containing protein